MPIFVLVIFMLSKTPVNILQMSSSKYKVVDINSTNSVSWFQNYKRLPAFLVTKRKRFARYNTTFPGNKINDNNAARKLNEKIIKRKPDGYRHIGWAYYFLSWVYVCLFCSAWRKFVAPQHILFCFAERYSFLFNLGMETSFKSPETIHNWVVLILGLYWLYYEISCYWTNSKLILSLF